MSDYPVALYREGTAFDWDGRLTDSIAVDDEDGEAEAASEGWQRAEAYLAAEPESGKAVSLSSKSKAELLEIAAAEGADVEEGMTVPDIKAAIELAREDG